ncbi:MAG: DMT family transporter [Phycisphaerales bacterium]
MPQQAVGASFFLLILLVFGSGVLTAFQHGMNSRFSSVAGHPIHGGLINFAVGLLAVMVFWAILARAPMPNRAVFSPAPWWMWLGGVCGGIYVCTAVYAFPRIGSLYHVSALVIGQFAAATLIDHFGLMGVEARPVSAGRGLGLVMMVGGLICMKAL